MSKAIHETKTGRLHRKLDSLACDPDPTNFTRIGGGCFQTVYNFPSNHKFFGKWVLKVMPFTYPHLPTLRWWLLCKRLDSIYLPRIKAIWLTTRGNETTAYCISEKLGEYERPISEIHWEIKEIGECNRWHTTTLSEEFCEYKDKLYRRCLGVVGFDLHDGNIMVRRNPDGTLTPVINDPWSSPKYLVRIPSRTWTEQWAVAYERDRKLRKQEREETKIIQARLHEALEDEDDVEVVGVRLSQLFGNDAWKEIKDLFER